MRKLQRQQSEPFFMLTPNVRDKLLQAKFTAAEWRMWCYLVSLDPFGDRGAKFSQAELMLKCGIKRAAYFKAKAKFIRLGLFDFQDGVTKVFNLQSHSNNSAKTDSQSINVDSQSINVDSQSINVDSQSINVDSQSINVDFQPLKSAPGNGSGTLQTIKTYSDFKDSLSEGEREKFLIFVGGQIQNLTKPINDVEAWLASTNRAGQNRWEVYYENFQKNAQKQANPIKSAAQKAHEEWQAEIELRTIRAREAWEKEQQELNKAQNCDQKSETESTSEIESNLETESNLEIESTSVLPTFEELENEFFQQLKTTSINDKKANLRVSRAKIREQLDQLQRSQMGQQPERTTTNEASPSVPSGTERESSTKSSCDYPLQGKINPQSPIVNPQSCHREFNNEH